MRALHHLESPPSPLTNTTPTQVFTMSTLPPHQTSNPVGVPSQGFPLRFYPADVVAPNRVITAIVATIREVFAVKSLLCSMVSIDVHRNFYFYFYRCRCSQLLGVWYEKGNILVFVDTQQKCDTLFQVCTRTHTKGTSVLARTGWCFCQAVACVADI